MQSECYVAMCAMKWGIVISIIQIRWMARKLAFSGVIISDVVLFWGLAILFLGGFGFCATIMMQ
jgi:hypothetical protein